MLNYLYLLAQSSFDSCFQDCLNKGYEGRECNTICANGKSDIFGEVKPPASITGFKGLKEGGLTTFINNILKLLIVGAGIYAVINLVLAGYAFMSAGDDPKKMQGAWAKIFQTLIGLAFAAGAFVLAAIFGQLIFGDPDALLQLKIFGPE